MIKLLRARERGPGPHTANSESLSSLSAMTTMSENSLGEMIGPTAGQLKMHYVFLSKAVNLTKAEAPERKHDYDLYLRLKESHLT